MWKFLAIIGLFGFTGILSAAETGDEVVIIYNSRMPGSKDVAEHYAACRRVPKNQIFGFALTTNEDISRAEYHDSLEKPLAKELESKKLWRIGSESIPATNHQPAKTVRKVTSSKIRYAVLCYGVPLRIEADPSLKEEVPDSLRPELRRNDAAVDNELALLPLAGRGYQRTGLFENNVYTHTNSADFNPTNGILMVARLDGPSASIARALVDKAMEAETNGLGGRAYFDLRDVPTNSALAMGDAWIMGAAKICQIFGGYDTVIDENPRTFPADFPMSQIAIYCGWYDENVSGPFAQKNVEFMPGAFAYHLHSFNAATIRSATQRWVGPLLAKGATCSMGSVNEPYISGTPDVSIFCARWILSHFTFGEAAYACQSTLSWQTTVVGDPLYRPFAMTLQQRLNEQQGTKNKGLEWTYARAINVDLLHGKSLAQMAAVLQNLPATGRSAVLTEKLGDIYAAEGMPASAIETYQRSLDLSPSPLQRVRIRLKLADKFIAAGKTNNASADLKALADEVPDYPGRPAIEQRATELSQSAKPAAAEANP